MSSVYAVEGHHGSAHMESDAVSQESHKLYSCLVETLIFLYLRCFSLRVVCICSVFVYFVVSTYVCVCIVLQRYLKLAS